LNDCAVRGNCRPQKVLGTLLIAETGILALLAAAILVKGGAHGLSLASFAPAHIVTGGMGSVLALAFGAFIGFEATAIYREEARTPNRTVPRATYVAVGFLGLFYAFISWVIIQAFGNTGAVQAASEDPAGMFFTAMNTYVGSWATDLMRVLIVTSLFARCSPSTTRSPATPTRWRPRARCPASSAASTPSTRAPTSPGSRKPDSPRSSSPPRGVCAAGHHRRRRRRPHRRQPGPAAQREPSLTPCAQPVAGRLSVRSPGRCSSRPMRPRAWPRSPNAVGRTGPAAETPRRDGPSHTLELPSRSTGPRRTDWPHSGLDAPRRSGHRRREEGRPRLAMDRASQIHR